MKDLIKELIYAECRRLSFISKQWAKQEVSGSYKSILKGSGIEFDSARVYSSGDDARRIDWKITARKSSPYIKSFKEDREQNILLLVDVSKSTKIRKDSLIKNKIAEATAYLCSVALFNKDKVGALLFDQEVIKSVKSSNKSSSIYNIIFESLSTESSNLNKITDLNEILRNTSNYLKKSTIVFIVSDFNFPLDFKNSLLSLQSKHTVYGIWVDSTNTEKIVNSANLYSGLIRLKHPETNEDIVVDLGNVKSKNLFKDLTLKHQGDIVNLFNKTGTKFIRINQDDNVGDSLTSFFMRLQHG